MDETDMIENIIFFCVVIISLAFAVFIIKNPMKTFEIQKKFYAMINWNIEPISLEKEIRNTKLMGYFLICVILTGCFYWWRKS